MAKVKKYGIGGALGLLPALAERGGKNAGFAFGILPGLFQRDRYDRQQAEEQAKAAAAQEAAVRDAALRKAAESNQAPAMKSGGKVGSASRRADGIAARGKTRGKMI